ncbi:Putative glycosyltransferase EpsH [Mycobacterium talmoniae]|uniref:Glycosyltransferase EpsH n=1 Tax=Mycobacterium talmoniae TaxID=1858794 RepID=A0A2S8BEU8_9MYCO|nr:Putative glycosyltransferase EpsH [Mycobacterium talmoniae]TDH57693.1 glycosyltransferase [Mycobacterium eburneum]
MVPPTIDDYLRFSIVIPAHNEEEYLGDTLAHIARLSYPTDRYEAIVVENGSSDRTLDVAQRFAGGNIRVYHSDRSGVSAAKNFGIDRVSPETNWVIFLDADTVLKPPFLLELNSLLRGSGASLSVGTTKVLPLDTRRYARAWFAYYNLAHRFGGSYAIQVVRHSLFPQLRFDENLTMGEDLLLIRQARRSGKFFYLPTKAVYTSTRRFDTVGYWSLFFHWSFVAVLPRRQQKKFGYEAIR